MKPVISWGGRSCGKRLVKLMEGVYDIFVTSLIKR